MDKKVPLRMCIVCKAMRPKQELVRIVKQSDRDYLLDITGKMNGRGAYICDNQDCMDKLVKTRALSRTFKTNVDKEVYNKILGEYASHKN